VKLSKIEVTNFRCFESLTLPLHPEVNVLVGANGAGKTSLLDAIATSLWDVVAANGSASQRRRDNQRASLHASDIHVVPGSDSSETGRKDFVQFRTTAGDVYNAGHLEWTDFIQYRPPNGFHYDQQGTRPVHDYFQELWQEIKRTDSKALIPLPVVAYYRADRRFSQMPNMGNIFELELARTGAYDNALNAGANFQAMCQWFYLRENAELRQKVQFTQDRDFVFNDLQAVRKALMIGLEGVERIFFDDNPPTLKASFARRHGVTETLELAQLSDGYRNLLALVLDFARRLAQAHPHWPEPLTAPGILLIDEIELHLHPRWQQTVIPNLRKVFPNTQIIVSTHSPQVLTSIHEESIRILKDRKLFSAPTRSYGAESQRMLKSVLETEARPPENENAIDLTVIFRQINAGQYDEAKRGIASLQERMGQDEPALIEALTLIENRQWEKELGL